MPNEERESALISFQLFMMGEKGSFMGKLFDCICKADSNNKERLRMGFPAQVEVWEDYFEGRINDKGEPQ